MGRHALVLALFPAIWAGIAAVGEWRNLKGDAIRDALEGRRLTHASGAGQNFRASGRALYNAGLQCRARFLGVLTGAGRVLLQPVATL